jgi:lipoprotein NlpD
MSGRVLRFASPIPALILLAGCASTPPAPVVDRSLGGGRRSERVVQAPRTLPASGSYRVRRGDTLYSIAFRHGLDYRELARANGIAAPYTIYVGQDIRLDIHNRRDVARAQASRPPPARPRRPPVAPSTVRTPPADKPVPQVEVPASAPPATAPSRNPVAGSSPSAPLEKPAAGADGTASQAGIVWRWPAIGKREGGFVAGDQTRQGIDIVGKSGDPVRAAADGVVVYSGNGLIGYGELIIIKHNAELLSAYGHNRRRLVQEGDRIKGGQQIAEMGSTSASRDMLHFEIRRNGKPVDPMAFLPRQ